MSLALRVLSRVTEVPAARWDALFAHEPDAATPFLRHAFLAALEESGCASARTGWGPRHITLWRGERLVAAAPAYACSGSEGDFSRDWAWAAAARDAGLPYYPKLSITVPFTPVTGRRLLVAAGEERGAASAALLAGAIALARAERLTGVHVLFHAEDEAPALAGAGLAARLDFQYHWVNAGYRAPDDFLARFRSGRRSSIRREKAAPARQGVAIRTVRGEELAAGAAAWADAMHALHRAAVQRMEWGMCWVNRDFYRRVFAAMPDALEVVEARRDGELLAAAFNAASGSRLYGRYWGCREQVPFLHFNVCLYHSVDECIRRGLQAFEGGAGGEHKLARGFEPALTRSGHLFLDRRLDAPLRRHLAGEVAARREALVRWQAGAAVLKDAGPGEALGDGDPGGAARAGRALSEGDRQGAIDGWPQRSVSRRAKRAPPQARAASPARAASRSSAAGAQRRAGVGERPEHARQLLRAERHLLVKPFLVRGSRARGQRQELGGRAGWPRSRLRLRVGLLQQGRQRAHERRGREGRLHQRHRAARGEEPRRLRPRQLGIDPLHRVGQHHQREGVRGEARRLGRGLHGLQRAPRRQAGAPLLQDGEHGPRRLHRRHPQPARRQREGEEAGARAQLGHGRAGAARQLEEPLHQRGGVGGPGAVGAGQPVEDPAPLVLRSHAAAPHGRRE